MVDFVSDVWQFVALCLAGIGIFNLGRVAEATKPEVDFDDLPFWIREYPHTIALALIIVVWLIFYV